MTHPLVPHPIATMDNRRNIISSTDARRIAAGEWRALWQEKCGLKEREDLTFAWKPRLGLATEKLHAWWHSHVTGHALIPMGEAVYCNPKANLPAWAATSMDYWVEIDGCPLELKHSHARNSLRQCADYYMAQLQWQMMVARSTRLRFSMIAGNEEPEWAYVEADPDYQTRLLRQAMTFWDMVQNGIEPDEDASPDAELVAIAPTIKVGGLRAYDYSTNNAWVAKAADYCRLKPQADEFKLVDKDIRKLVPADAGELRGGGITVKRTKAGQLRFSIDDEGGD